MNIWNIVRRQSTGNPHEDIDSTIDTMLAAGTTTYTAPMPELIAALRWAGRKPVTAAVLNTVYDSDVDAFTARVAERGVALVDVSEQVYNDGVDALQEFRDAHAEAVEDAKRDVQARAERIAPGRILHRILHGPSQDLEGPASTTVSVDLVTDLAVVTVSATFFSLVEISHDDHGRRFMRARKVGPGTVPVRRSERVTAHAGRTVSWSNGTLTIGNGPAAFYAKVDATLVADIVANITKAAHVL